jgi:elongation factor Ts
VTKKTGNVYAYNHMNNTLSSAIFYTSLGGGENIAKDCALQVAAMAPIYVSIDDVSPDRISALTQEFTDEMATSNKPEDIKQKIIE